MCGRRNVLGEDVGGLAAFAWGESEYSRSDRFAAGFGAAGLVIGIPFGLAVANTTVERWERVVLPEGAVHRSLR